MKLYFFIVAALSFIPVTAQTSNCESDFHQQFDFWIGEWQVFDTSGALVGENTISKIESNCVISEEWKGSTGGTGRSFNYFDTSDSTWNQIWLDNSGNNLILKGKYDADKMTLKSTELNYGEKGPYYDQISWSLSGENSVLQLWDRFYPHDKKTIEIFRGIYKLKSTKH